ncbi:unnamed protein product [Nippostrongylus brasiliensis]|uniref:Dynein light chain n=1 Tax=Nippostrongylus brasiliensis TaxID=27835 RepID=A0A0N4YW72_NIPBR|nr:unnamed protein product [Nippostrongylus brasiliensis]
MPTPAQRGLAKGQRHTSNAKEASAINEVPSENADCRRNVGKKFFKRSDDTMDKVLDEVDFQNKFAKLPEFTVDHFKVTPSKVMRNIFDKVRDSPGTGPLTSSNNNTVFFGPSFNGSCPDFMSNSYSRRPETSLYLVVHLTRKALASDFWSNVGCSFVNYWSRPASFRLVGV